MKRLWDDKEIIALIQQVVSQIIDVDNVVYTTGDQEITGKKKFLAPQYFALASKPTQTYYVDFDTNSSNHEARFVFNGSRFLIFRTNWGVISNNHFIPNSNNQYNLGSSSNKWKDIYLNGKLSDGTNDAKITDLANLIAYAKSQGWIE